jgi:Protein of unknown function (DUF3761)
MFLRAVLIAAAAIAAIPIGSAPPANSVMECPQGYYRAASGDCVHRPVCGVPSPPAGATAKCADGCYSFSEHPYDDETCNRHGGAVAYPPW